MIKILEKTETTGSEFRHPGGVALIGLGSFQAGAEWRVQAQLPGGEWVDDQPSFSAGGVIVWYGSPEIMYRITGGSVGAEAWVFSVSLYGTGII